MVWRAMLICEPQAGFTDTVSVKEVSSYNVTRSQPWNSGKKLRGQFSAAPTKFVLAD